MTLARARQWAIGTWIVLAVVVWNGLYDLRITLGNRDYLMKQALHEAGRGPAVSMAEHADATVKDAVMVATLWAGIILGAGLATIVMLSRAARPASS